MAQRPLVCWALAYLLGLLAALFGGGFSIWLGLAGMATGVLAAVLLRRQPLKRFLAVSLAFFFLGSLLMGLSLHPLLPPEGNYQVRGRLRGEIKWNRDASRVQGVLEQVQLQDPEGKFIQLSRALWSFYPAQGSPLPLDGQQLAFAAQVLHPQGQLNPHGFDFRRHLLARGIPVHISGAKELSWQGFVQTSPADPFMRVRLSLGQRLDALLGEDSGLAKALLLGVREGLEEETGLDFRITGIAHVLAVSGLHVGLLALFLLGLMKPLRLPPFIRLLVTALLLLMYCALLGFRPSVVRASILFVLFLTARVFRRQVDPLTSLAAAFLLILLLRPLDILDLGFQLSFLAVAGIITLGDRVDSWLRGRRWFEGLHPFLQRALSAYGITLSASLMTLVPLVNSFHSFSLMGLLISPLAIALVGLLMQGFLGMLLLSLPWMALAMPLAQLLSCCTRAYLAAVAWLARLPYASLPLPHVPTLPALLWYAFLILLTRYVALSRRLRLLGLGVTILALLVLPLLPGDQGLRYIQLSSGFADSALILDGPHTTVIDAGEHAGDLLRLLYAEHRQIDRLILTHFHQDHVGGLQQILDSGIRVEEILLPEGLEKAWGGEAWADRFLLIQGAGIPLRHLGRGDLLLSPRVRGEVRWPPRDGLYPGQASNLGSLVIYWDLDGVSLLSTGDISAAYAPYAMQPAQVLKISHHGSKADNPVVVLAQVSPRLALITASDWQADRHLATRERLGRLGAANLVTGQTGAVTLRLDKGALSILQHLPKQEE